MILKKSFIQRLKTRTVLQEKYIYTFIYAYVCFGSLIYIFYIFPLNVK